MTMSESVDFFSINTEQTNWDTAAKTLSHIRHQVFVKEQGVPEALELDEQDADALHWIAWGPRDKALGVARLVGNKIGRMAVLEPYRNKGVGSALLRAIINYAVHNGLDSLVLDAQKQAVSFYSDNGFTPTGEEFMDAGIPHIPMSMNLARFIHRRVEPAPPDINEEARKHQRLDSVIEFTSSALTIARESDRTLRIFSERLYPEIYDQEDFCHAVFKLATRHPNAKVQLLVRDSTWLAHNFHRLVETYHRLLSHIEMRRLNPERHTLHTEFLVGDNEKVMYMQDPDRCRGYYCEYAPVEAKRLTLDFDSLWESSLPDPEVRRLYI